MWDRLYHIRAGAAYALVLVMPLIYTMNVHTFRVNRNAGWLLLVAALLLAPSIGHRLIRAYSTQKIGALLVFAGIFFVAWQWQHGDVWLNSQFLLYSGLAVLYPISVQWFRRTGSDGLRYVFMLKLAGVLGATLLFCLAIADLTSDPSGTGMLVREPPIYRDTRHFNYDHLFILSLAAYFASISKSRIENIGWFLACVAIGYVLAWSGGRAAIGSLAVFLLAATMSSVISRRTLIVWVFALLLSFVLVVATDRSGLLIGQLSRFGEAADVVASGRLEIWAGILSIWWDSWATMFFGLGPDAVRMVRAEFGSPPWVQAHGVIFQALIEFGLIGLGIVLSAIFLIARRAWVVLRSSVAPRDVRAAASLLVAFGAYMLVDGILYHAIPLIVVMLLTAYLFHYELDSAASRSSARSTL